jgi:hypothetical protein
MTTDSTITPELLDQLLANYTKPEEQERRDYPQLGSRRFSLAASIRDDRPCYVWRLAQSLGRWRLAMRILSWLLDLQGAGCLLGHTQEARCRAPLSLTHFRLK